MNVPSIKCIVFLLCLTTLRHNVVAATTQTRLDVFRLLMDGDGGAETLSVDGLQDYIDSVMKNLRCSGSRTSCRRFMCVNATNLVTDAIGVSPAVSVTSSQFESLSVILLDLITRVTSSSLCYTDVDTSSLTFSLSRSNLLTSDMTFDLEPGATDIDTVGLTVLTQHLDGFISSSTRSRHTDDDDEEEDIDDHDESEGQNQASIVLKSQCLAADTLMYYMEAEEDGNITTTSVPTSQISELATAVVYLLFNGSKVQETCRDLPHDEQFSDTLFGVYSTNGNIDVEGLSRIMGAMGRSPQSSSSSSSSSRRRRRRRSVAWDSFTGSNVAQDAVYRTKRQTFEVPSELRRCYNAEQLLSIFDGFNFGADESLFQQVCPALVSQSVFADCSADDVTVVEVHHGPTCAEKYGYGTIAITIICSCTALAALLLPWLSAAVYAAVVTSFLALAVGTLAADAVLHLIPVAFDVHEHTPHENAEEDTKIIVEDFVLYGLAILTGIYLFYLLEVVISKVTGSHDKSSEDATPVVPLKDDSQSKAEEAGITSSVVVKGLVLTPLAMMILFGDALHNLADGLVVGAAFASSVSTGIATSIAVLCHEIPREAGDIAILLTLGWSLKQAVVANLLSALVAYLGLYIGIGVGDSDSERMWFFAFAAGTFLYIALVKLIPRLLQMKSTFLIIIINIGILLGFLIMFLLAIFEEHIDV